VLTRREPEKFRPAQRTRAPVLAATGLVVIYVLVRGSGWEVWAFTAATALLPLPYFFWGRRRINGPPSA